MKVLQAIVTSAVIICNVVVHGLMPQWKIPNEKPQRQDPAVSNNLLLVNAFESINMCPTQDCFQKRNSFQNSSKSDCFYGCMYVNIYNVFM